MTTNSSAANPKSAQRRSLHPPEHPRKRQPHYFDDTLDAHPPYHLFDGPSTPEEIEAAREKARKRGLLPPDHKADASQHERTSGARPSGRAPANRRPA